MYKWPIVLVWKSLVTSVWPWENYQRIRPFYHNRNFLYNKVQCEPFLRLILGFMWHKLDSRRDLRSDKKWSFSLICYLRFEKRDLRGEKWGGVKSHWEKLVYKMKSLVKPFFLPEKISVITQFFWLFEVTCHKVNNKTQKGLQGRGNKKSISSIILD